MEVPQEQHEMMTTLPEVEGLKDFPAFSADSEAANSPAVVLLVALAAVAVDASLVNHGDQGIKVTLTTPATPTMMMKLILRTAVTNPRKRNLKRMRSV